jgi:S-adenosylmethionine synthetase
MAALKANGVAIGAPEKMTPEVMDKIEQMLLAQRKVADVAVELGVSRASIYGRFTVGRRDGKQTVERRDRAGSPPLRLVK